MYSRETFAVARQSYVRAACGYVSAPKVDPFVYRASFELLTMQPSRRAEC